MGSARHRLGTQTFIPLAGARCVVLVARGEAAPDPATLAAGDFVVKAFIDFIAENPDVGDVIPGADGARKVRWHRKGAGKRGGARVIYFHLVEDELVLMVMVYAKAERTNVKPKDIKRS